MLFILPLALIRVTVWVAFPGEHDWGEVEIYLTLFVYGYALFSRSSFIEAIRRQMWIALSVGILSLLLTLVAYVAGYLETWESAANYTPGALIYQVVPIIYSWSWLVFVLACGIRWLNITTNRLSEANEAVLPIYVLHQPAIVLIAFFVVQWPLGILPKWLIISTLAVALTMGLYVLVIRRLNWIRWLFGMKPRDSALPFSRDDEQGNDTSEHGDDGRNEQRERNRPLDDGASQRRPDRHSGEIQAHRDRKDSPKPTWVSTPLAQREEADVDRTSGKAEQYHAHQQGHRRL